MSQSECDQDSSQDTESEKEASPAKFASRIASGIFGVVLVGVPIISGLNGQWHTVYVQCCLAALIVACCLHSFRWLFARVENWAYLVSAFICITLLAAQWLAYKKIPQSTDAPFSVEPLMVRIASNNDTVDFLLWQDGKTLSPINVVLLAQIVNLKEKPLKIYQWQFEGKTTNNDWQVMPTIDARYGKCVVVPDRNFKLAAASDSRFDFFPNAIEGIMIESEPLTCWIFLESPTAFNGQIRLRVWTPNGGEHVQSVNLERITNRLDGIVRQLTTPLQHFPLEQDISSVEVRPYSVEKRRLQLP